MTESQKKKQETLCTSRFVFELVIWPQEVTLARWTQPSGPLCLWQCLYLSLGSFTLQRILIILFFFLFNWCFNLLFKYFPPLGALIFLHLCVSFDVGACFTFFLGKYLFIRWLRSWKANNRLYRAQHGQALSLLLLCFVLQWSDDQDSPSARCNKPIKGTFTAHPRLVVGQIVGTFDLGEQRRFISPDTDLKILDSLCAHLWDLELQWHLNIGCDGSDL